MAATLPATEKIHSTDAGRETVVKCRRVNGVKPEKNDRRGTEARLHRQRVEKKTANHQGTIRKKGKTEETKKEIKNRPSSKKKGGSRRRWRRGRDGVRAIARRVGGAGKPRRKPVPTAIASTRHSRTSVNCDLDRCGLQGQSFRAVSRGGRSMS